MTSGTDRQDGTPFTDYPYRIEPTADPARAIAQVDALKSALQSLDRAGLLGSASAGAYELIRQVAAGEEQAPAHLLVILSSLSDRLKTAATAELEIEYLLRMCALRTDSCTDRPVNWSAGSFASTVLWHVIGACPYDFIVAARSVWRTLKARAASIAPEDLISRRKFAVKCVGRLAYLLGHLNLPGAYDLLALMLRHCLPEIRAEAGKNLRYWKGGSIREDLLRALAAGVGDAVAASYTRSLLFRVRDLGDPALLPALRSLAATNLDCKLLQDMICTLEAHNEGSVDPEPVTSAVGRCTQIT